MDGDLCQKQDNGGSVAGSQFWGICKFLDGSYWASTGAGDSFIVKYKTPLEKDKWHVHTIRYNGTIFTYFIDGVELGSFNKQSLKNTKLFIGGISNSGTSSAGQYWGYGNGYYRNLAIYDDALSDDEIQNYSF